MKPRKWIIAAHVIGALGLVALWVVADVQRWELGPEPFFSVGVVILLLSGFFWWSRAPRRGVSKTGTRR